MIWSSDKAYLQHASLSHKSVYNTERLGNCSGAICFFSFHNNWEAEELMATYPIMNESILYSIDFLYQ
jgi:hypothetical protein